MSSSSIAAPSAGSVALLLRGAGNQLSSRSAAGIGARLKPSCSQRCTSLGGTQSGWPGQPKGGSSRISWALMPLLLIAGVRKLSDMRGSSLDQRVIQQLIELPIRQRLLAR